jgi:hypothetical protein
MPNQNKVANLTAELRLLTSGFVTEEGGEVSFVGCESGFGGGAVERELLHDDSGLYAAGSFEEGRGGGLVDAGGGHDDAVGAIDELGVGGLHVHHEVAVDGSGLDHDAGGEHVEDELGCGAGFEARAAGEDFGAGEGGDGDVGGGGHGGVGDAGERNGEGAEGIGVGEGSEDVGGSAAGGYAYERVLSGEACGCEVGCALLGGVFGGFAGFAEGGVAAGDETLHESCGDGEGRRNFAGVEDAEAAAGACSDVEEVASVVEAARDFVDSFGDCGEDGGYGCGYFGVFFVDEAEHVESGEFVDVLGCGVAGFGEEGGEVHGGSMMHDAGRAGKAAMGLREDYVPPSQSAR